MADINGLLLAAGQSSRFGADKLVSLIDGLPLILHAAKTLSCCPRILAVVNKNNTRLIRLLEKNNISYVINHKAINGIGASIACGVMASPNSDGWLILPSDMPGISEKTTAKIIKGLRDGQSIVAPVFNKQQGHPVGFSKLFKSQLAALNQDTGARVIIKNNPTLLHLVEVNDPAILIDIDYPQPKDTRHLNTPKQ